MLKLSHIFKALIGLSICALIFALPVGAQTPTKTPTRPATKPTTKPAKTPVPPKKPTTKATTTAQKPSRSVRSSTPSRPSTSKSTAQGKYVAPEFKIQADIEAPVLMFEPVDVRVQPGEPFRTEASLVNPRSLPFNGVNVAVRYDPQLMEPTKINTIHLDDYIETKTAKVFPGVGIIVVRFDLKSPVSKVEASLFSIHWKALAETEYANISFTQLPGQMMGIFSPDGINILAGESSEMDGCLSSSISIQSAVEESVMKSIDEDNIESGILLRTQYEFLDEKLDKGSLIRVDVLLDNPNEARFNVVHVEMGFDPELLRVLDWDNGNLITAGINVHDGMYKDNFKFTHHIANRAINTTGDIVYRMGKISNKDTRRGPDPIFSIILQVKKPFSSTEVFFKMPESYYQDGTRINYLGHDVLGDPLQPDDGVENVVIQMGN